MSLFRAISVTSNNVANSSTAGFKKQFVINNSLNVKNISYANDVATVIDTTPGDIVYTNNPYDVAIIGDGYFKINSPLGARFTKGGKFSIDGNGTLVDRNFFPVASADGDVITIPPGSEIVINQSGDVIANSEIVGKIGVFKFENEHSLEPTGGNLYKTSSPEIVSTEYSILNGSYEGSNVSGVSEMQDLIEIQRYAEMTANMISMIAELEQNAVKTLSDSAKQ
jgi:flagellar basal-body rod protein FlgF